MRPVVGQKGSAAEAAYSGEACIGPLSLMSAPPASSCRASATLPSDAAVQSGRVRDKSCSSVLEEDGGMEEQWANAGAELDRAI